MKRARHDDVPSGVEKASGVATTSPRPLAQARQGPPHGALATSEAMTVTALRGILRDRGLAVSGVKAVLVRRLLEADAALSTQPAGVAEGLPMLKRSPIHRAADFADVEPRKPVTTATELQFDVAAPSPTPKPATLPEPEAESSTPELPADHQVGLSGVTDQEQNTRVPVVADGAVQPRDVSALDSFPAENVSAETVLETPTALGGGNNAVPESGLLAPHNTAADTRYTSAAFAAGEIPVLKCVAMRVATAFIERGHALLQAGSPAGRHTFSLMTPGL